MIISETSPRAVAPQLDVGPLLSTYRCMVAIRLFEERTTALFLQGAVKGTAHSYIGQEAVAAAVCGNLRPDDYIGSYHRGHGHCIAKGADLGRMMAELLGRADGYCGGLGGSMHVADLSLGILGANGIVGAAMPLCAGAALAAQQHGTGQVAVAFFGDGASNQGVFHESMNLAAVWKLPLVFVCENNKYALTTPYARATAGVIADRAAAYGTPALAVDGNDLEAVYHAAEQAVARARAGGGPTLIEARTFRWGQHSMRANLPEPRTQEEIDAWMARDPLKLAEAEILRRRLATRAELEALRAEVQAEVDAAVRFGEASPQPTMDTAMASVCAPSPKADGAPLPAPGTRKLSYVEALAEGMGQAMAEDERVVLLGEDIGETGGIFQATKGLHARFGAGRVRDTPISEATFVGAGVGAALAGLRPVVEIQIFDFVAMTMDMIVNQAAKLRYMMGGKPTVPLVIRGPQGGGIRMAAQHSQSLEAWFAHVPGLVVVGPSSPYDAKGLILSAIRDDNPVIFLENKLLYLGPAAPVPEEPYAIPLGKGEIKRPGRDVTVVATMAMVPRALGAANQLAKDGIEVEVIDPRTFRPLDEALILESVRRTNRLVIAHEAWTQYGFGAEVSALVMEQAFDWLDAPVTRVGAPAMPMPYNDELERQAIPSQQRIVDAIRGVLA